MYFYTNAPVRELTKFQLLVLHQISTHFCPVRCSPSLTAHIEVHVFLNNSPKHWKLHNYANVARWFAIRHLCKLWTKSLCSFILFFLYSTNLVQCSQSCSVFEHDWYHQEVMVTKLLSKLSAIFCIHWHWMHTHSFWYHASFDRCISGLYLAPKACPDT